MKYFINYADKFYLESQKNAIYHAKKLNFDCKQYGVLDLDLDFRIKNQSILSQPRGAGYWLWKPYIILKKLNDINYGDYLVYMDSGANLINSVDNFLQNIDDKGILSFQLKDHKNNKWTKGDCFFAINDIDNIYQFSEKNQILASYIFFRKNDFCINFVKKWLYYSMQEHILTDIPNLFIPNCLEFCEHRHDQSIFSLLCYKYNISHTTDISQWGGLNYINHHRTR